MTGALVGYFRLGASYLEPSRARIGWTKSLERKLPDNSKPKKGREGKPPSYQPRYNQFNPTNAVLRQRMPFNPYNQNLSVTVNHPKTHESFIQRQYDEMLGGPSVSRPPQWNAPPPWPRAPAPTPWQVYPHLSLQQLPYTQMQRPIFRPPRMMPVNRPHGCPSEINNNSYQLKGGPQHGNYFWSDPD